jgi:hypothetical protein
MVVTEVPVIARVECRSEGSAEQRPVAVWFGGERIEIERIVSDIVVGAAEAGGSSRRSLRVGLSDGRQLSLTRDLPDGDWRVYRFER